MLYLTWTKDPLYAVVAQKNGMLLLAIWSQRISTGLHDSFSLNASTRLTRCYRPCQRLSPYSIFGPRKRLIIWLLSGRQPRTRQVENAVLEKRPVLVDLWEQVSVSGEFRWAQDMGTAGQIALARGEDGRVLTVGDAAQGNVQLARGCVSNRHSGPRLRCCRRCL